MHYSYFHFANTFLYPHFHRAFHTLGDFAVDLQKGWEVTGIDVSSVGLQQAAARAVNMGVHLNLVEDDILNFQLESAIFSLVVICNIHLIPFQQTKLFERAEQALSPGGHLFVIGHHVDSFGHHGPPDIERLYTVERLRDELPSDITIDRLERIEIAESDNLEHHQGTSVMAWGHKAL